MLQISKHVPSTSCALALQRGLGAGRVRAEGGQVRAGPSKALFIFVTPQLRGDNKCFERKDRRKKGNVCN